MKWTGSVMPAEARKLQARVEAGEIALELTNLRLGDGIYDIDDDEVDKMTALKSPKYTMGISSRGVKNNVCTITGVVFTQEVSEPFYARELGIYARDPSTGKEILYLVSVDRTPGVVEAGIHSVANSVEYVMKIVVSNVKDIKIEIDYGALTTTRMLREAANILDRKTHYLVGDTVRDNQLRPGQYLKCVQEGQTAINELILPKSYELGDVITDGTVKWQIGTTFGLSGDCWKKDSSGNIVVDIPPHNENDPVLFAVTEPDSTGQHCIVPVGRLFYSYQWKYDSQGNIIPRS